MSQLSEAPDIPLPSAEPGPPSFDMPAGAWDTHFHVIDPQYGFVENRSYTPHEVSVDMLREMHGRLGIDRGAFIQVSAHGTDNRALMDALRAMPHYRGVCVVEDSVSDLDLDDMHAAGVRGARVNVLFGGGVGFENLPGLGARLAKRGWHLQVFMDITKPDVPWSVIEALPCPVIIDHLGHWDCGQADPDTGKSGVYHPAFQRLLNVVADGAWAKLIGAERCTRRAAPPFDDAAALAQALIAAAPDRVTWGSDWPHVKLPIEMMDTGDILNQLEVWAPDEVQRRKILVDNPERFYTAAD